MRKIIISYPAARKTSSVLHYYYNATKKEFISNTLVVADTCRKSLAIIVLTSPHEHNKHFTADYYQCGWA